MGEILDWAINRGGAWAVLAIVGPLIAWHLKAAKSDINEALEKIEHLERNALLSNGDLQAALTKLKLELLDELEEKFVSYKMWDTSRNELIRRVGTIDSRLERHEQWHLGEKRRSSGETPWPPKTRDGGE